MLKRACLVTGFLVVIALFNPECAFPQNTSYFLPYLVNGSDWLESYRTTFIFFNNTDSDVMIYLELKSDVTVDGKPIPISIPGLGTDTHFSFMLHHGVTRFLQSDGSGHPASIAAVVTASAPIGVSALITSYGEDGYFVSESAVVVSNFVQEFVLPLEETGPLKTALAVFSPQQGNIGFTQLDTDGHQVSSSNRTLDESGRLVLWMTDIVPNKEDFRGTLVIQSSVPAAVLGIGCFPPLLGRPEGKTRSILAHVSNGAFDAGRFMTSFAIVNLSSSPASVTLALTNDDGAPLVTALQGKGTSSSFEFTIAPGGSIFARTDGTGPLVSGTAVISSDVPVGAAGILSVLDEQGQSLTETGLVDSPTLSKFTFPVDETGSLKTGVAFYNPSASAVSVNLRLLDTDGAVMGTTQLNLPARSHTARFVSELFPGKINFLGSVAATGTDPVAVLILQQNNIVSTPSYASLPVSQGTAGGDAILATPRQVNGVTGIVAVTADAALKSDGTVWALNPTYSDRTTLISMSPTQVVGLTGVEAISVSMALKSDGTVWDFSGSQPAQVSGLTDVVAIHQSAGGYIALKRDGTVWAPGPAGPFEVTKARGAAAVAEMAFGGLALMSDGTVWHFGLMGEESDSYLSYWGQLDGVGGIVAIDAMYDAALGLKSDGTVWDLGDSVQVQGITGALGISAGPRHHLGLAQDGTIWEWGHDYLGLGHTEKTTWPTPRQVVGLTGVVKIAASWNHSLALKRDGTVWVWESK